MRSGLKPKFHLQYVVKKDVFVQANVCYIVIFYWVGYWLVRWKNEAGAATTIHAQHKTLNAVSRLV